MITKKEICDVLKKYLDEDIQILPNRIQNNKVKALCVEDSTLIQNLSFRGTSNSNIQSFRLTIRYSENETESENFSRNLYKTIKEIKDEKINENNIWSETLKITEPVSTGTVKNNIYEQRLDFAIIYNY